MPGIIHPVWQQRRMLYEILLSLLLMILLLLDCPGCVVLDEEAAEKIASQLQQAFNRRMMQWQENFTR